MVPLAELTFEEFNTRSRNYNRDDCTGASRSKYGVPIIDEDIDELSFFDFCRVIPIIQRLETRNSFLWIKYLKEMEKAIDITAGYTVKVSNVGNPIETIPQSVNSAENNINNIFSFALPSISFGISALSTIVFLIFAFDGQYIFMLPAVFVSGAFLCLGVVVLYVRRDLRKIWREKQTNILEL